MHLDVVVGVVCMPDAHVEDVRREAGHSARQHLGLQVYQQRWQQAAKREMEGVPGFTLLLLETSPLFLSSSPRNGRVVGREWGSR